MADESKPAEPQPEPQQKPTVITGTVSLTVENPFLVNEESK